MKVIWPVVLLGLSAAHFALADSGDAQEGVTWLRKMASAANQIDQNKIN